MQRNLDVTTYGNGDPIPEVTDPTAWSNLTTGAWCWYNNDAANGAIYGKLYNWYAATDSRGLCPTGWHLPTDAEWTTMETTLGGSSVAGGKIRATSSQWIEITGANNSSGFSGLPGGLRNSGGDFFNIRYNTYWWSATAGSSETAFSRYLERYDGGSYRFNFSKINGFSVRCVKN
jgi:uncharacterized protein (TIGR02145 family)